MRVAEPETLLNKPVFDVEHHKIGKVKQLYIDNESQELTWAAVTTGGLFGSKESMLPLDAVHVEQDGVVVDLTKDVIQKAPQVDADAELTEKDEDTLLNFYNAVFRAQHQEAQHEKQAAGDGQSSGTDASRDGAADAPAHRSQANSGNREDYYNPDDAMTRSEEQLHVDKDQREHARLRLKKYVVTEHETVNVPLKKEQLRLEREPITDENRDAAMKGPELSEATHDVVLHKEVPQITKETKPVERVRMTKDTTEHMHTEDRKVRKERMGIENLDESQGDKH